MGKMTHYCGLIPLLFPRALTTLILTYSSVVTWTRATVIDSFTRTIIICVLVSATIYTYFKVISIGAGSPLDFEPLKVKNSEHAEVGLEFPPEFLSKKSVTLRQNGRYRYCATCGVWKPDRSHHCSSCNKCYLKRDHHCPWFSSCIGFNNQKFFVQFLMYSTLYSISIFIAATLQIVSWFRNQNYTTQYIDINLLVVWLLSTGASVSLFCFTGFSIYLLTKNQTTNELNASKYLNRDLEIFNESLGHSPQSVGNPFDLGSRYQNWCVVMGYTWREWLLPIKTDSQKKNRQSLDEKGLFYQLNSEVYSRLHESMFLQDQLMKRLSPRSSADLTHPLLSPGD
ncbi:palmitoyltransferase PFA3 Ecym_2014 [Eremothecium cymbalariae DBVPG|uniref:Palmitoyltransferase n=1 Tax=Eremothecium cymbalariae (strain CBS 270.75 / DBVPG 7215 / KCTC 17166 / NRRL Y-17582) TaxID=931890 RepID=G8JNX3_ERECY|nr:Hypothetical protein Ecym_2014 [Eremothecium cymbalariae DBVPG\